MTFEKSVLAEIDAELAKRKHELAQLAEYIADLECERRRWEAFDSTGTVQRRPCRAFRLIRSQHRGSGAVLPRSFWGWLPGPYFIASAPTCFTIRHSL